MKSGFPLFIVVRSNLLYNEAQSCVILHTIDIYWSSYMRKTILFFLSFLIIICSFTILCVYMTEKTDVLNLQKIRVSTELIEKDGKMILTWQRYPYPCFYQVETYFRTTGLVEGEPEYKPVSSSYTFQDSCEVPSTDRKSVV